MRRDDTITLNCGNKRKGHFIVRKKTGGGTVLGRLTDDTVTTLGIDVAGVVRRIRTENDPQDTVAIPQKD